MNDFDIPGHDIVVGIYPSPFDFPAPNKRPFSSISPAILTNNVGRVQLVIGAFGGKRITTALVGLRNVQICMHCSLQRKCRHFTEI